MKPHDFFKLIKRELVLSLIITLTAIITGMLNKENISCINRKDGENMDKILYTYQMLTKVILAIIFTLFCVFIAISSPAAKIPKAIFLVVLFYVLYICIFGIVYTRELVALTIRIYKIKNANDIMVINEVKSSDIDEIRIDILMRIIMQTHNISLQDMIEEMKNAINSSEYKNKDELIKYINKKYGK